MYRALAVMVVFAGCVPDAEEPAPTIHTVESIDPSEVPAFDIADEAPDLCALAASLPLDDVCSLICDPEAMATMLVDEGMPGGRCYQLRCALSETASVSVGVCLPP